MSRDTLMFWRNLIIFFFMCLSEILVINLIAYFNSYLVNTSEFAIVYLKETAKTILWTWLFGNMILVLLVWLFARRFLPIACLWILIMNCLIYAAPSVSSSGFLLQRR